MDDSADEPMRELRRRLCSSSWAIGLTLFVGCLTVGAPAFADFVDTTTTSTTTTTTDATVAGDPLLGYFPGFKDNGTNTPTSTYPANFGFTVSPSNSPASGDLVIDILVPNNEFTSGTSYTITGTDSGGAVSKTASLVSGTAWTSGDLAAYLNYSPASPTNPIGAFDCSPASVCANAYDPGLTGFYVYQANLNWVTLQGMNSPDQSPILNISSGLPPASYIVAFFDETPWAPSWIATASSGAILYAVAAPEPSSLALLGGAIFGLWLVRRRRLSRPALSC